MVPKDPLCLQPALNPPVPGGGGGIALSCLGVQVHGIFQAGVLEWGAIAFSAQALQVLK